MNRPLILGVIALCLIAGWALVLDLFRSRQSELSTYRIVQLGQLDIYRVEQLSRPGFCDTYYWKAVRSHDSTGWNTTEGSALDCVTRIERLQARDKEREARQRNAWRPWRTYKQTS